MVPFDAVVCCNIWQVHLTEGGHLANNNGIFSAAFSYNMGCLLAIEGSLAVAAAFRRGRATKMTHLRR